jgi:uncharacterized protein
MTRAPRVVLDTNVVLSALIFAQGRVVPLRQAWHDARCRPLASRDTIAELVRALTYPKFGLSTDEQRELLADYLPCCTSVRLPAKPPKTPACRDPHDVAFLRLAVVGTADYLVTGDRDLLALAGRLSCPVVAPNRFLAILDGR